MPYNKEEHRSQLRKEISEAQGIQHRKNIFTYYLPGGYIFDSDLLIQDQALRELNDHVRYLNTLLWNGEAKDAGVRAAILETIRNERQKGAKSEMTADIITGHGHRPEIKCLDVPGNGIACDTTPLASLAWLSRKSDYPLSFVPRKIPSVPCPHIIPDGMLEQIRHLQYIGIATNTASEDDDKVELELPKKHKTHITL